MQDQYDELWKLYQEVVSATRTWKIDWSSMSKRGAVYESAKALFDFMDKHFYPPRGLFEKLEKESGISHSETIEHKYALKLFETGEPKTISVDVLRSLPSFFCVPIAIVRNLLFHVHAPIDIHMIPQLDEFIRRYRGIMVWSHPGESDERSLHGSA